jgi:MraZ protein
MGRGALTFYVLEKDYVMGGRVRDKFGIFQPLPPPPAVLPEVVTGLTGLFTHRFGQGYRLYLPAAFRVLGRTLVLSGHPDGYLRVDAPSVLSRLLPPLAQRVEADLAAVAFRRYLAASAVFVPVDSRGRFAIPPPLRTHAGMQQHVVFVGRGDHAEAWAAERWEQTEEIGQLGN